MADGSEEDSMPTTEAAPMVDKLNESHSWYVTPNAGGSESNGARPDLYQSRKNHNSTAVNRHFNIVTCILALLAAIALGLITHSYLWFQRDAKGCRMSYMYPSYAKLDSFDAEHTRFATKYSLYLYREQGVDNSVEPIGTPVLFIPGNAGSYKQVRPIAAQAASQFAQAQSVNASIVLDGYRNLDFFTVDFNEDFSAFHGQTLLDQAEYLNEAVSYILSLYHHSRKASYDVGMPDPTSIIVVGHSMGGIVARTMLTMGNYLPNSINTIITMAAPHAMAPVPFDWDMQKIYASINSYWRRSYSSKWANNNPLWHVTLISIAGGGLDSVICSDYTTLSSLVPRTHGFTVYTSSIPGVWTGMDHQAILWCDQFRKVVASALLEIIDVRRATQTKSRAERMNVFRQRFLLGLEDIALPRPSGKGDEETISLSETPITVHTLDRPFALDNFGLKDPKQHSVKLLALPTQGRQRSQLTLLTNHMLQKNSTEQGLLVFLCELIGADGQTVRAERKQTETLSNALLSCKNVAPDVILLPSSTTHDQTPWSGHMFSYLQYDMSKLSNYQYLAILDQFQDPTAGFLVTQLRDLDTSIVQTKQSLPSLIFKGATLKMAANRSLVTEFRFPVVDTSLLAYKVVTNARKCGSRFAPMLRQYISDPYESKFFVNVEQCDINLHGAAPYLTLPMNSARSKGLTLQMFVDPLCTEKVELRMTFDLYGSFGKVLMRYRILFVSFPILVIALVLKKQMYIYNNGGPFISFGEGLICVVRQNLLVVLFWASVGTIYFSTLQDKARPFLSDYENAAIHPWKLFTAAADETPKNDILLGLQDPCLWILAPIFILISVGVTVLLYAFTLFLLSLLTTLYTVLSQERRWKSASDRHRLSVSPFNVSSPKRRLITTLILLLIVATIVPYQFAYIVACVVQIVSCIKALRFAKEQAHTLSGVKHWSFYHYSHSLLMLMICLLPINIPVLLVWIRNLSVQWLTPFSSHHNVLSIAPFILLVETLTSGQIIPRIESRFVPILLLILAWSAVLYGVMYAYLLHYLTNAVIFWFTIVHFTSAWKHKQGNPASALFEMFGNETKKHP